MDKREEFIKAIEENNSKRLELFINDPEVEVNMGSNQPIKMAANRGYFEITKLLLKDKRVDPSDDENHALQMASEHGHIEIVELLLSDKRVNPVGFNNYAIKIAIRNKNYDVASLLIKDKEVEKNLKKYDNDLYKNLVKHSVKNKIGNF